MTDRERRALAKENPKDFIPDSEWDFIESLAACKGDGIKNKSKNKTPATAKEVEMAKYTDGQNRAYGAGVGYASAKAGKRVDIAEENKESFLKGIAKIRGKKQPQRTREDKIKYYSGRIDDPKSGKVSASTPQSACAILQSNRSEEP